MKNDSYFNSDSWIDKVIMAIIVAMIFYVVLLFGLAFISYFMSHAL
jgi:hypothetical protein